MNVLKLSLKVTHPNNQYILITFPKAMNQSIYTKKGFLSQFTGELVPNSMITVQRNKYYIKHNIKVINFSHNSVMKAKNKLIILAFQGIT